MPVVGADNAGFVGQLNSVKGLIGAAVTNPGSIGGAGVTLALKILDGEKPAAQTVLVQPELWENATDDGKAKLAAAADPSLEPRMAGQHLDPRLDHLHQGPDHRLQGPGRIMSATMTLGRRDCDHAVASPARPAFHNSTPAPDPGQEGSPRTHPASLSVSGLP